MKRPSSKITIDVAGMGDYYLFNIYEAVYDWAEGDGSTNDEALEGIEDWLLYTGPDLLQDAEVEAEAAEASGSEFAEQERERANKMRDLLDRIRAERSNPISDAVADYFSNPANEYERRVLERSADFRATSPRGEDNDFGAGTFYGVADLIAHKIAPSIPGAEDYEVLDAVCKYFRVPR